MKHPEPYWRSQRDSWCVQVGKKQITLAKGHENEAEAWRRYYEVMAAEGVEVPKEANPDVSVAVAIDLFLVHTQETVSRASDEQYRIKLDDLARKHGNVMVVKLTTTHLADWVKSHEWSSSTKRGAITTLKVWLNWCLKQGLIQANPAAAMKRPKMGRRERTITPSERPEIRAAFTDGFGDFLDALTWTGARPGEVMRLEAAHVDWETGFAALPGKTTEATSLMIEFPLTTPMLALCKRLAAENPTGPLFRNKDGNPWTANAVRCRMRRLRGRLGSRTVNPIDLGGVTAYTYRHSFATDSLERGIPVTDVAALMNHRDIRTTMNYAHLTGRKAHLMRQAEKATGDDGEKPPITPA